MQLNDSGIFNLISIILSPIISFVVLIQTLQHDKKQFAIQLNNQRKEHQETLEIMKKQHKEDLDKQTEVNRIAVMPYLIIDKSIKITYERGFTDFEIFFVNKGNGIAIEVIGKYLDKIQNFNNCLMFESVVAEYYCVCPFDYETNVVKPEEKCCFQIRQNLKRDFGDGIIDSDKVHFKIQFKDLYSNKYEQEFTFFISGILKEEIKVQLTFFGKPQIIR